MNLILLCIITFIACTAFSIHYNIKGRLILFAAIGGTLTFFIYEIMEPLGSIAMRAFIASTVSSIYSESLARLIKVPATSFLIISIIPLVPGSNVYHAMELCINNQVIDFLKEALHTLGIAGAIALGILLVSSLFRFVTVILQMQKKNA